MLVNEYAASNNIVTAAIACTSLIGQQQTSLDVAEREQQERKTSPVDRQPAGDVCCTIQLFCVLKR